MDQFNGGCLCGSVRLVATGRPYRVGICHCLDCRKHHGALFHTSAIFPREAVSIVGEMIAKRNLGGRPLKQGVRHRPAARQGFFQGIS